MSAFALATAAARIQAVQLQFPQLGLGSSFAAAMMERTRSGDTIQQSENLRSLMQSLTSQPAWPGQMTVTID